MSGDRANAGVVGASAGAIQALSCILPALPADYPIPVLVEAGRVVSLSADEPVHYSRPSIDLLFESPADAFGAGLVGVILTGANEDGAAGLRAVAAVGGVTVVENPATAFAPTMPTAALELCAQARPMSLDAIAAYLVSLGTSRAA